MGMTTLEICPPEWANAHLNGAPLKSATSMDCWALGCVLYHLITSRRLMDDLCDPSWGGIYKRDKVEVLKWIRSLQQTDVDGHLDRMLHAGSGGRLMETATGLLKMLLKVNPTYRYATGVFFADRVNTYASSLHRCNVEKALQHEFISGVHMTTDEAFQVRLIFHPSSKTLAQVPCGRFGSFCKPMYKSRIYARQ